MRVLEALNFDAKKARGVYSKQMRMVDPHSLEPQIVEDFSGVEDDYGAPFMFFHRIDLHSTLKDMAVGDEGEGPAVKIRNGVKVKGVDCGAGRIEIDSGETFEKDLIVIADGVHVSPFTVIMSRMSRLTGLDPTHQRNRSTCCTSRRHPLLILPLSNPHVICHPEPHPGRYL